MMGPFLCSSIRDYIHVRISSFTEHVLSKNLTLVLTVIAALSILWIMIQGYLIATGRSQEGLKGLVYGLGKTYPIVVVTLDVAAGGDFGVRVPTDTLSDDTSQTMTDDGDADSKCLARDNKSIAGCRIDRNLTAARNMMGILDGIDAADNGYFEEKVTQARWFVDVGTTGPVIVAGIMLVMFRITMAFLISSASIFILRFLFKRTAPLFQKWLYYGLTTILSSVMLDVTVEVSMDLVGNIAITDVVSNVAAALTDGNVGGIMQTVTQQLGLGLMFSTLLIIVPPMVDVWFNGMTTGSSICSVIGNGNRQEVPPHLDGGASQRVNYNIPNNSGDSTSLYSNAHYDPSIWTTGGTESGGAMTDVMKSPSQPGKGNTSIQYFYI